MVPPGVAAVGAIQGGLAALLAIGIVLVYQAHRFLHLAHAALGAVAGAAVTYLVAYAGWNYWLAYPTGVALGALLGVVSGMLLAERLADASRVVVLVCSIGFAFVFGAAQIAIALRTGGLLRAEVPIGIGFDVFPVRISGAHVLAVASVAVALVTSWFLLQRTDVGLRIRALATGPVHARRLGIAPHTTWRTLWAFCGVLAAMAGIAGQPLVGTSLDAGPTLGPFLLALTAAVVGRMRNLPLTVTAAIVLGVAHATVAWFIPIAASADAFLVAVILVVLLVRAAPSVTQRADPDAWRFVRSIRPVDARHHLSLRIFQLMSIAAVAIGAVGAVQRASQGDAQRIGTISVFALAAIAVHVSATFGGRLSLGHWAVAGLGTVVASLVGPASGLGLLAAVAASAVLAALLSAFFLRGGALAYLAASFAVAAVFPLLHARVTPAIGDVGGFGPLDLGDQSTTTATIVVTVALVVVTVGAFRRSRTGTRALAVRDDARLASVHGVSIVATTIAVEALSGAIAGLAGFLYLWNQGTVHPDAFAPLRSLELVAMSVVGGIGSVGGTVLGAGLVQGAQLFASGPVYLLSTGAGIFVVAVWLRGGLASLIDVARSTRRTPAGQIERGIPRLTCPPAPERFADAPSDATRKARRHPAVGRAGTLTLVASAAAGWFVLRPALHASPVLAVWVAIGAIGVASLAAVGGAQRGRTLPAAFALLATTIVATRLLSTGSSAGQVAGLFAVPSAGWIAGAAFRDASSRIPASLRSAAAGWIFTQAAVGSGLGALIALIESSPLAPIVAAVIACAVALRPAAPGRAHIETIAPRKDGVHIDRLEVRLADEPLLRNLTLHVEPGRICGIAGPNGVGKSTLLRCIVGEIRPQSGSISVGGLDATTCDPDELARAGVLLMDTERGSNGGLSVYDNLRVAQLLTGANAMTSVASAVLPRLTEAFDERAAVLSGGERRLLALAQALTIAPRVLLADELGRGLATDQLDVLADAFRELASRGTTVLVVEHDPRFLSAVADTVVHL